MSPFSTFMYADLTNQCMNIPVNVQGKRLKMMPGNMAQQKCNVTAVLTKITYAQDATWNMCLTSIQTEVAFGIS